MLIEIYTETEDEKMEILFFASLAAMYLCFVIISFVHNTPTAQKIYKVLCIPRDKLRGGTITSEKRMVGR